VLANLLIITWQGPQVWMVWGIGWHLLGSRRVGDPDMPIIGIVGLGTPVVANFGR